MVGSLFGIVLAKKLAVVGRAYEEVQTHSGRKEEKVEEEARKSGMTSGRISAQMVNGDTSAGEEPNIGVESRNLVVSTEVEETKDESSININTVKKILFFWALTVPVALIVAYLITALLLIPINQ